MAGANLGLESRGEFFNKAVEEGILDIEFKCLWVMNRDKDSVDLLKQYMELIKYAIIYPIKNLWFGKDIDFSYYHSTSEGRTIREMVMKRGGRDFCFPTLNQKLTHKLYTQQMNFDEIREDLPGGMRISLSHWISQIDSIFDSIWGSLFSRDENVAANGSK
jgi:hypothetical protein